jgi:hemerythrin-like domain-containing protein
MLRPMPRDATTDAFGMLRNSHRRLAERLAELREAVAGPLDERARDTIDSVLGFFERAVARHEADEEATLFPRLARVPELAAMGAALAREHARQADLVESLGHAFDGRDDELLRRLAGELSESYAKHVALEEDELFPAAERLLDADTKAEMLAEMDRRRGR